MNRNYDTIMSDIEETQCLKVLLDCRKELSENRHNYTLVQLRFAVEHISKHTKRIAEKNANELKETLTKLGLYD